LCRIVLWSDLSYIIDNKGCQFFLDGKPVELPKLIINKCGSNINPVWLYTLEILESEGVKCINSYTATTLFIDKLRTLNLLASNGIKVPKSFLISREHQLEEIVKNNFELPLIIKPIKGSLGKGIQLCRSFSDLVNTFNIIKSMSTEYGAKNHILVQEYIGDRVGQDLRIIMTGNVPLGCMLRKSENDFKANISAGATGEAYPLTDDILDVCAKINSITNVDICGIDLLFSGDGFKVCEVNTNPGFEGFEKYCDKDIAKKLANYAIEQYNKL
jgi:RimK family alpha-L-glutamate ligase